MPAPDAPIPTEEAIVPIGPTTAPGAPVGEITTEPGPAAVIDHVVIDVLDRTPEFGRPAEQYCTFGGSPEERESQAQQMKFTEESWLTWGDDVSYINGQRFKAGSYTLFVFVKAREGCVFADDVTVTLVFGDQETTQEVSDVDGDGALSVRVMTAVVEDTGEPFDELPHDWEAAHAEMNDELWDIYHRAMEGREDETWYEPYVLLATKVTDGTYYEFGANATEEYPYWPEAWTPDTFGPEVPFFFIVIHEDIDGGCEVVSIKEPMYEPGGEAPAQPEPPTVTPTEEEIVPIAPMPDTQPDILSLTFSEDGSYAKLNAAVQGLYARVALVLETNGESGLYITQAAIGGDGVILIPEMHVPGLTVTGVNVALVTSPEDITSPTAEPVLFAFR